MPENRMLIIPDHLVGKIDQNRGDLSQAEFIDFLIGSHLGEKPQEKHFVTAQELQEFEQGIRELLRNFLDFFVSYSLELKREPARSELEELSRRLEAPEKLVGVKKGLDYKR